MQGRTMLEPKKLIKLHGSRRRLKGFQVAQLAVSRSRTLAALLPKLLSGELRVPAAAHFLEDNA
jgi:hypothetical protein